jgi:hypothetical protein
MGVRLVIGLSAALVVASWVICALGYATQGGGGDAGIVVLFLVAAVLTVAAAALVAAALVVRTWRGSVPVLAAAPVSVVASLSILWLVLAIGFRG